MHSVSIAEVGLSLFTTTDRASSIAGDLIEEAGGHNSWWFAWQVVRTMTALVWEDFRAAAPRITFLATVGAFLQQAFFTAVAAPFADWLAGVPGWGMAWPQRTAWIAACVVVGCVVGPLVISLLMASLSGGRQMTVCVAFLVIGHALVGVYHFCWFWFWARDPESARSFLWVLQTFITGRSLALLLVVGPVLATGYFARRRFLRQQLESGT